MKKVFTLISSFNDFKDRPIIGICRRKFKNLLRTKYVIVYDDTVLAMKNSEGIVFDIVTENIYSKENYPNLYFVSSTPKYYLRQYDETFNIVVSEKPYRDIKYGEKPTNGKVFSVYENEKEYLKIKLGT